MAIITRTARSCRETAVLLRSFLYGTVVLKVARWNGGQFVLWPAACLNRMIGILCCAFQFIFNITWKKKCLQNLLLSRWRIFLSYKSLSQNCKKGLLASSCPSLRLSVRVEQFGSHATDFHEIRFLSIFQLCQEYSSFIKIGEE